MKIGEIGKVLSKKFGKDCRVIINNDKAEIETLLTDSRNHFKPEGTLFFAIKTKGGNDGHHYIKELYNKGVRNFIAEYIPKELLSKGTRDSKKGANSSLIADDINLILVPDSIEALTEIGKQHRSNSKKIVAIAGSRGKTTIKEMLFQLLEPNKNISRSPRSFNSKIGVPLSLWQIPPETDLAIIEAGISKRGEMQRLADAIDPDIVILTNIGEAHSQGFFSQEEKATEKAKIAYASNVKKVIYPENDILIVNALKNLPDDIEKIPVKEDKNEEDNNWDSQNKALAKAFMKSEGFSADQIEERLQYLHKINTRMNVSEGINGCTVILDSYTSDFSSLLPAIDFMSRRRIPSQSLTLILSDLQHEGKDVMHTYREIAKTICESGISRFIGVGENMILNSNLFSKNSHFFKDTDELLNNISASDFNNEIILLKGAPEFDFARIYQQLEAKKHETVLEVNLDAMLRNYNYFRSKIPSSTGIIAMVKASGYGAGSYEIAKTLQDAGAAYLAVAALDEGIELRNNGISMPIMVMNPRAANYRALFNNHLEPVIYSMTMLKALIDEAGKYGVGDYPVHIKLDTGMHRMGFEEKDLPELISLLKSAENIRVASIFSHLATADCLDMDSYTHIQLDRFDRMSSELVCGTKCAPKRHILNSAGILRFPEYHYDLVRLGIGLYGANTLPSDIEKPLAVVSTLRSVIICIREIDGDEAVGYGRKGEIRGKRRIATIPIGYADGMNRHFGNGNIKVLVNGKKVPTIGNICMDATMIDVTDVDCDEGDSVEIFGEKMSVQALADTLDTIPYEVLTSVSPRVKRVYYRE